MEQAEAQRLIAAMNTYLELPQEEIARRVGVSFSTVNAWSSGRRQARQTSLVRLREAFDGAVAERPQGDVAAVAAALHRAYGSPRLGNRVDPLDELFFILLSLKTSHTTYEETFRHFRRQFRPWKRLLDASPDDVESHIRRGGLGSVKARAFVDIARRLSQDFGTVSLAPLRRMSDADAEAYLVSLPGVGLKTARCVLMYSLAREVIPVDTHTYRVGVRLGVVPTSKSSLDVHAAFARAVPARLRYSIHTNFVALGRDACRDPIPECERCPVQDRCPSQIEARRPAATRRKAPSLASSDAGLTAVDLYSGCGGLSAGLRDAGFDVRYALDWDAHACATHDANFPEGQAVCADVRGVSGKSIKRAVEGTVDLVAGGPNCQGVSERGIRSPDDPRNFMFPEFVRLVSELRPAAFLLENVPGLTHRHNFELLRDIFAAFETELGYRCGADVLLAANYGVPQLRYRFFMVGLRDGHLPTFPEPTHVPSDRASDLDRPHVTTWEAIGDLPPIEATRQTDEPLPYEAPEPENEFQTYARKESTEVRNHVCSATDEINLLRAAHIPEGGNWKDIPPELLPERFFMSRMTDHSTTYARLRRDHPAFTITALFGNITAGAFTHPLQTRALSVREGARLQGFRDTFVFRGPRNSMYRQIGNAVPPLLAGAVARHLMAQLRGEEPEGRAPRITSEVLNDQRAWDALPVLTPRFRALFGGGTRWPSGWGKEPQTSGTKLDANYRLRREFWPEDLRRRSKKAR